MATHTNLTLSSSACNGREREEEGKERWRRDGEEEGMGDGKDGIGRDGEKEMREERKEGKRGKDPPILDHPSATGCLPSLEVLLTLHWMAIC